MQQRVNFQKHNIKENNNNNDKDMILTLLGGVGLPVDRRKRAKIALDNPSVPMSFEAAPRSTKHPQNKILRILLCSRFSNVIKRNSLLYFPYFLFVSNYLYVSLR